MSESEFHYVRTTGVDGGVDAVDGRAIGVDIDTILKDGLPPFKAALEMIAALCEILDIADQDGEVHGDIGPSNIFLDDTGAVSVEGFGTDRSGVRAPEGAPVGTATDLYGLGYVAYRLLATRDLTDLPADPDDHDDAVIDAVIALPWGDMPEEWVGDIQWFLAKLMSHDPDERPPAVDAWRTFIAFAEEADGVTVVDWSVDAIEGGGERRDAAMAVRPATDEDEELGGPKVSSGPLQKGAISFGGGSAKSGQATAFWSKEQMKAALEADEEEEETFKPQVGGGSATSFWTRDQMEAMARGDDSAPRPKRKEGGGARKPTPAASRPSPTSAPTPAAAPPPAARPPATAPPPAAAPPAAGAPPASAPPIAATAPVAAAGPPIAATAGPAIAAPVGPPPGAFDDDDDDEAGGGGMKIAVVGIVVVLLLLLCLGIASAVGLGFLFVGNGSGSPADSTETTTSSPSEEPAEEQDTSVEEVPAEVEDPKKDVTEDPPKADPKPVTKPDPPPTTRRTTPTTRRTTPTTRRTTPNRGSTTTPAASGPTSVIFTVPAAGKVRCGDGTSKEGDGKIRMTFRTVPSDGITCSFIEGGSPVCAGIVNPGNRKCACNKATADLTCS